MKRSTFRENRAEERSVPYVRVQEREILFSTATGRRGKGKGGGCYGDEFWFGPEGEGEEICGGRGRGRERSGNLARFCALAGRGGEKARTMQFPVGRRQKKENKLNSSNDSSREGDISRNPFCVSSTTRIE